MIADEPLEIARCDKPTGKMAAAAVPLARAGHDRRRAAAGQATGAAGRAGDAPGQRPVPRTIANRIWQRLMGRGIVHPVDVMANEPWSEDLLEYLAAYLVDHGYDLKTLIEHIVDSRTYQSKPAVVSRKSVGRRLCFPRARRSSG